MNCARSACVTPPLQPPSRNDPVAKTRKNEVASRAGTRPDSDVRPEQVAMLIPVIKARVRITRFPMSDNAIIGLFDLLSRVFRRQEMTRQIETVGDDGRNDRGRDDCADKR